MKTVVITGVSSGIGLDLAKLLIEKGYQVIGLSRREVTLEGLKHLKCDISSLESVQNVVNLIKEEYYSIDYLINNAGMGIAGPLKDSSYEDIDNLFNTNLIGTIRVTKELLPLIISSKGRIICIGSVAGDLTIPYQGFYSMSKSALDKFSEALSMELKIYKVKVTTILPGDTKTGFTEARITKVEDDKEGRIASKSIRKMEKDEQKGVSPRKVSKTIYRVMKRRCPPIRVTVGFGYKLLVFLQRLLPRKLVLFIISKLYV